MCDFFSQSWAETAHHGGGGDLADIVRASGVSGPSTIDPASAGSPDPSWQYLLLQNDHQPAAAAAAAFPPPLAVDSSTTRHASSFGGLRGPALLHELSGGALRASPLSPVAEDRGHGVQQVQSPRTAAGVIKRRKSQAKKVVCIPAAPAAGAASHGRSSSGEVVPSDLWAWRKYGQKPIKGSPYPRGYYRCSSSKGCSARKQVERSRTDPNMLVITYTSEHNHPWPTQRNALAGSTRSLQASRRTSAAATKDEATTTTGSSTGIVKEEEESSVGDMEKDEAFDRMFYCNVNEPAMDESDDFFAGLAELDYEQMSLMYD